MIFPFPGIWFADSHTLLPIQQVHFLKNSYIKIILSLQACTISYNKSQGALHRSKYSSGAFSINFPHSNSFASVLTASITCSLSMGLIEKGIVSNHQCNSSITSFIYLFIHLFIYLFIQNYQHSISIIKYYLFL